MDKGQLISNLFTRTLVNSFSCQLINSLYNKTSKNQFFEIGIYRHLQKIYE